MAAPTTPSPDSASFGERLVALGHELKSDGYRFHTPTPATQARILARPGAGADLLQEVFGWNKPVDASRLPTRYQKFAGDTDLFSPQPGGCLRARVRFSSLGPLLLAHSGYPTEGADAVFFGPDTYRFAHALRAFHDREPGFAPGICLDIGAGTGAGGLFCASLFPGLRQVALLDINSHALAYARANAALNDIKIASPLQSDILTGWPQPADLIISNPPYLLDSTRRTYRHGGGDWGASLSLRILEQALGRLGPAGHLLLYTGSAIVGGQDTLLEAAAPVLKDRALQYRYDEIDPDVFGEELDNPPYDRADRIATVVLHVKGSDLKPGSACFEPPKP